MKSVPSLKVDVSVSSDRRKNTRIAIRKDQRDEHQADQDDTVSSLFKLN